MKRALSLLLACILSLGLMTPAFAASDEAAQAADILNALDLFDGVGTDANGIPIYDLDRAPTRHEAVTMLVGLLGKKDEALAGTWNTPFTDVADWAKPFVGYAYANGLTAGTSSTTFGGDDLITAAQYLTFALKVLGYEAGKDFQWNKAWELSDKIGMTDGRYNETTSRFSRGDLVLLSVSTLESTLKASKETLFNTLKAQGQFPDDAELSIKTEELTYYYGDDDGDVVFYDEAYIQSASVTKIGDRYQFEIKILPEHFYYAYFFPAGYQTEDVDGYSIPIAFHSTDDADIAAFSVSEDFLFNNPINCWAMVFDLVPILTAFPDDFQFAEGCADDCIMIIIENSSLPR